MMSSALVLGLVILVVVVFWLIVTVLFLRQAAIEVDEALHYLRADAALLHTELDQLTRRVTATFPEVDKD